MSEPFFTILIPTKNRAHLVGGAVESVLSQTFQDFEIIVVDNDDADDTRLVLEKITDPRVHYLRTGGLSMVDNWNAGCALVNGSYMTVLEDKISFYPWSLEYMHAVITECDADVLVWGVGKFDSEESNNSDALSLTESMSSESIITRYVNGKNPWGHLPRLINSCVSTNLMFQISSAYPGGKFFNYGSPDLVAAFLQLAFSDRVFSVNKKLMYIRDNVSNASGVRVNKAEAIKYFSGTSQFDVSMVVSNVPIKNPCIVHNTIYNDFLQTEKLVGRGLSGFRMTDFVYAKMCLRDVYTTLFKGGNIKREMLDIYAFMRNNTPVSDQIKLAFWWLKLVSRRALSVFLFRPARRCLRNVF